MKSYFLVFFILVSVKSFSQSDTSKLNHQTSDKKTENIKSAETDSLEVYKGPITQDVNYPDGYASYISKELLKRIPKEDLKKIPKGTRILVSAIITAKGTVRDFEVIKSPPDCAFVIDALKIILLNMKGWSPALNNGKPVNRKIVIPIVF